MKINAVFFAILAAALYALNAPVSKLLLNDVPPTMMAAFLYLGAGLGMLLLGLARRAAGQPTAEKPLTRKDLPYTLGMIVLDVLAPILLLLGFVAYGLSIYFYVRAQRNLGAARTSAFYAVAPFIGVLLSLIIFRQWPGWLFFAALAVMIAATVLGTRDQAES